VALVATPPAHHVALTLTLLRGGKHVACEKPLCLTVAEADQIIATAAASRRMLTVHQNRRWDPDFVALRRTVGAGLLGEIFNVETFVGGYAHPCRTWHSDTAVSGGAGYDWGSHHVDWVLQLLSGTPRVVQANGHKRVWHDVTNLDQIRVRMTWADGREAEFLQSDIAAVRRPKFYVQGTAGTLVGSYRTITLEAIEPGRGYVATQPHHAEAPACRRPSSSPSRFTATSPITCISASRSRSPRRRSGVSSACSKPRSGRAPAGARPSCSRTTGADVPLPALPVGWGVIGATSQVAQKAVLPAIVASPGARLVAVASESADDGGAGCFEPLRVHRAYDAVLDDPEVEAVYVPLPNSLHREWVVRAAAAGKHVLCEKPLAPTVADAEVMTAACEIAAVALCEAYMTPFHPRAAVLDTPRRPSLASGDGRRRAARRRYLLRRAAPGGGGPNARASGGLGDAGEVRCGRVVLGLARFRRRVHRDDRVLVRRPGAAISRDRRDRGVARRRSRVHARTRGHDAHAPRP